MIHYDWQLFLDAWTRELKDVEPSFVEFHEWEQPYTPLGIYPKPGATEQQLAALSERLGIELPPSYRSFLALTNGCEISGFEIAEIFATDSVVLFDDAYEEWVTAYIAPRELDTLPSVPDKQYFVYGEKQEPCYLRVEYLENAIQISAPSWQYGGDVFLLIPDVVTAEGEYEAWYFSNDIAGARRYVSFWEMMLVERKIFQTRVANY